MVDRRQLPSLSRGEVSDCRLGITLRIVFLPGYSPLELWGLGTESLPPANDLRLHE